MQQIGSSDDLPFCCTTAGSSVFSTTSPPAHALATVAVMVTVARVDDVNDLQHPQRAQFARCSATD